MMSKVLFDREGLKIWTDGLSPIIFLHFGIHAATTSGEQQSMKKSREALHAAMAKFNEVYSVVDLSECSGRCSASLLKFWFAQFPELLNQVKFIALISTLAQAQILQAQRGEIGLTNTNIELEGFGNFFSALGRINKMREAIPLSQTV